jgi:lambda family phage minor tail protein L
MISADSQKLAPGNYIVLFQLDLRCFNGPVYYFTPSVYSNKVVRWRDINDPPGITDYTPWNIKAEGFEMNGQGTLPRPSLTIGNVNMALSSLVRQYLDLQGATLYRYRTLKHYLVGEPQQDLEAHWNLDLYRLERKTAHNKSFISWDLRTFLDCEGQKIPFRQILRDTCTHLYRVYVSDSTFDYTKARCPYSDTRYYDQLGNPTTPDKDRCGRKLTDCRLRFPGNAILPTSAFPGVAKVNVRQ